MMSQQSQVDFVDDKVGWDVDKCRQNIDSALPEILMKFKESTYIEEGIGLLQIICNNFLPVIPMEEAEDKIFSHISDPTHSLVKDVLNKIHLNVEGALKDTVEELRTVVIECLQWLICIADCIEICIRQMQQLADVIPLSCIKSLPVCAIGCLTQSYLHCKESSSLYGDLMSDLEEPLSALFKKAHALQLAVLSLLEKISVQNSGLEAHVEILCSVCNGLFEICKVVTSLDIKLAISLWKGISKLCSQNLKLLKDRLDVCPLICHLCCEVTCGYAYLFQLCPSMDGLSLSQGDDRAFTKCVKVQGFLMKVLVALLRDFADYLGPCEDQLLKLLLYILRCLSPSLSAFSISDSQESEIRCQVANAIVPALQHLVSNRAFRIHLTSDNTEDLTHEDSLPLLLLQLNVLDLLPKCEGDVQDSWLMPANHEKKKANKNILLAVFESVKKCFTEMRVPVMLPGPMVEGKPQSQVSLYQHVIVHLCGFIGACSARHFQILECCLLDNVFEQDELGFLLATDCWCFLARYGSASLCQHHVKLFLQVLNASKSRRKTFLKMFGREGLNHQQVKLVCILQRLVKFLSPEHQTNLLDFYKPEENLDLWATLTFTPFCVQVQTRLGKAVVLWSMKILDAEHGNADTVLKALSFLSQVLTIPSLAKSCLDQDQQIILLDIVCQLWSSVYSSPNELKPIQNELLIRLLPVTKYFLQSMETAQILQVIQVLHTGLKNNDSPVNRQLLLATAEFMVALGTCKFTPSAEGGQVLLMIPKLFYLLLSHTHPLVQTKALVAFNEFARHTVHEECISASIQGDASLNTRVNNYLQQIPYCVTDQPFVTIDYLRQQHHRHQQPQETNVSEQPQNDQILHCFSEEAAYYKEQNKSSLSKERTGNSKLDDQKDDPPTKRAKLEHGASILDEASERSSNNNAQNSTILSTSTVLTFPYILEKLEAVADDLETICTSASRNASGPPQEFITQAGAVLSRINDFIGIGSSSWFDSLS